MNNSIYKKGLAVVLIIALILMTLIGIKLSSKEKDINFDKNSNELTKKEEINTNNVENENINNEEIKKIIVDIDGAVNNPGVYEFLEGDRVNDAIIKAGGLKDNADTKDLNKARKLADGEKIYIIEIGEEPVDSSLSLNDNKSGKININTASKEMLMTINGIGEVYSDRIIEYRNKNKFKNIEEIKNVNGIGEKTFEKIKEFIMTD